MTHGLKHFAEAFRDVNEEYAVVGGMAAATLMEGAGVSFRGTKDIDLVIIAHDTESMAKRLQQYIQSGHYEIQEKNSETPIYYRFKKPKQTEFPFQLEVFHRKPNGIDLFEGQHIVPISDESLGIGLSAILLEDDYFDFIRSSTELREDLRTAKTEAVIALKARAYNDLQERKNAGDNIDAKEIRKHRNDIFRLSQILTGDESPEMTELPLVHLKRFIDEVEKEDTSKQKQLFKNLKIDISPEDSFTLLKKVFQVTT